MKKTALIFIIVSLFLSFQAAAGTFNISSGPEYGITGPSKYHIPRNFIKINLGYESFFTETLSGELEAGYSYQMAPYNMEMLTFKAYLHKYFYQGKKWSSGIYGGPGISTIISGIEENQPDINGKVNFTLTAGLEAYREASEKCEIGFRTGIDHGSNAATAGERGNPGRNGIFGLFTVKLGKKR